MAKAEDVLSRIKPLGAWDWDDPLEEFHVEWMAAKRKHADRLEACLKTAKREEDVQQFLQNEPMLLIQHLGGGHGRYVIPKKKFGSEYVTDFVIGERHSGGMEWQAVELESPHALMFTKKGDPTAALNHAIKQIHDWRAWLVRNQAYAARLRTENGLGLTDVIPNLPGFILIGRRRVEDEKWRELRRQLVNTNNISIHSFDFLVDNGRQMAKVWASLRNRK
jgi:hypothetical protein